MVLDLVLGLEHPVQRVDPQRDDRHEDREPDASRLAERAGVRCGCVHGQHLAFVSDGARLTRMTFEERWPRPAVMGVLNVTPDSFSDGGRFVEASAAIEHGRRLAAAGCGARGRGRRIDASGRGAGLRGRGARACGARARGPGRRRDLDRHVEGSGGAICARARRRAGEQRHRASRQRRPRGGRRRGGCIRVPHAHAGRAPDDAGCT